MPYDVTRMSDFDLIVLVLKQELSHRSIIVTITGSTVDMIVIIFAELLCCIVAFRNCLLLNSMMYRGIVGLPKATHVCHRGAIEVFWN